MSPIRTLFPTAEELDVSPVPAREDLSRILVITVPDGDDPADHVPAWARYGIRSYAHLQSVVRDRWQRESDRPCWPGEHCSQLVRCLNGRGPCGEEPASVALGMGVL